MTDPAMGPHHCSACGQMHGGEGRDAEVKIAKINADRDIEVARISRGEWQHNADVEAETEIAVTEMETAAGVQEAEALAGALSGTPAEPEPVIVDVPAPDVEPEVGSSIQPRDDDESSDGPPPPEKKSSLSYWP
jgi:hypothetical protein